MRNTPQRSKSSTFVLPRTTFSSFVEGPRPATPPAQRRAPDCTPPWRRDQRSSLLRSRAKLGNSGLQCAGMSLERRVGPVLVGDLLDREDAPVGGAHEEPRELAECRVAERLRRPNGLADDSTPAACTSAIASRMSSTTNPITKSASSGMSLASRCSCAYTSRRSRRCVGRRWNVTVSPSPAASSPITLAEEGRHGVDVVGSHADVSDSPNPHAPTLLARARAAGHFHASVSVVHKCAGMSLERNRSSRLELELAGGHQSRHAGSSASLRFTRS